MRDEHGTQATASMRPQHAEALALGGQRADGVGLGSVPDRLVHLRGVAPATAEVVEGRLQVRVLQGFEALARGPSQRERRETLLGVAPVSPQVARHQRLNRGAVGGVEPATICQVIGQGPGAVAGPSPEGGDQLILIDEAVLKR